MYLALLFPVRFCAFSFFASFSGLSKAVRFSLFLCVKEGSAMLASAYCFAWGCIRQCAYWSSFFSLFSEIYGYFCLKWHGAGGEERISCRKLLKIVILFKKGLHFLF